MILDCCCLSYKISASIQLSKSKVQNLNCWSETSPFLLCAYRPLCLLSSRMSQHKTKTFPRITCARLIIFGLGWFEYVLFAKLNTSNMVVDFDFIRFVCKYFWVPGMFGILVLNFTSCAENYDPATRLLPISVLFSPAGENSAKIHRLRTWCCRTKKEKEGSLV